MQQEYVVGFLFNEGLSKVALIRKNRPAWQAGKLNGIGGYIEFGETPEQAMAREFLEETSCKWPADAIKFAKISKDGDFTVYFFAGRSKNIYELKSITDESVEIVDLGKTLSSAIIENLLWLIPLAQDVLADGTPNWIEINYPNNRYQAQ